jgi:NADH-quinone oxidoreductase subunit L
MYYAYTIYIKQSRLVSSQTGLLYRISFNEWYIDRFYNRVVVKFVLALSDIAFWFDRNVIDGFVNLLEKIGVFIASIASWCDRYIVDGILHLSAAIVQAIGGFARRFQNGKVQYYLFSMLLAVIVVFILKILIWN